MSVCEVLRDNYAELCDLLDASPETLNRLAVKMFSKNMIDMAIKNEVLRIKGFQGADTLLKHLMMKVEAKPERFNTILEIMIKHETTKDITEKMKKELQRVNPLSPWTSVQMIPVSTDCEFIESVLIIEIVIIDTSYV